MIAVGTSILVYSPPTPLPDAPLQVHGWMDCPTCSPIGESGGVYIRHLEHTLTAARATGPVVHDARILPYALLTASTSCGLPTGISPASPG